MAIFIELYFINISSKFFDLLFIVFRSFTEQPPPWRVQNFLSTIFRNFLVTEILKGGYSDVILKDLFTDNVLKLLF